MRRIYAVIILAFVLGIAVGAGGAWAIGISSDPQVKIVEGYTTAVNQDGEAIGLARDPDGPGKGYQIAGAWWREAGGAWQTHGPTCLEPLISGQKVRLGIIPLESGTSSRGEVVVWLECLE